MTSQQRDLPQMRWKQMRAKRISDVSWLKLDTIQPLLQKPLRQKQSAHKTTFWNATVKDVCWTQRDSERHYMSKWSCCFFLKPFDEWWVVAASVCSHCSWSIFTTLHRKFHHVIITNTWGDVSDCCFSCLHLDVESDWSPIHDAAFNGRVLALQRLIAQVKFNGIFWDLLQCMKRSL